jgi:predicted metal-dependent hydrolase
MSSAAIEYSIRRSQRARRIRITVDAKRGVEVVLPLRATHQHAADAVDELTPWINRRLLELDRHKATVAARGTTLPYLDGTLTLVSEPGRTRAHRRGDSLYVPADPADQQAAIERWYRRVARDEFETRASRACASAKLSYAKLTVRGQKTRWGSCTREGALSFNWRLLLAPEAVLDYVVWHEVCHLAVMDHSPKFWGLVAEHCPDYKQHAAWLRRSGATLVL